MQAPGLSRLEERKKRVSASNLPRGRESSTVASSHLTLNRSLAVGLRWMFFQTQWSMLQVLLVCARDTLFNGAKFEINNNAYYYCTAAAVVSSRQNPNLSHLKGAKR